jgi:GDP-L-fucose synthase
MNKDDTILVTGAGGLVGSAILEKLGQQGFTRVVGITHSHTDLLDLFSTLGIFWEVQPDIVFHCAARVYGILGNMNNQGQSYFENTLINSNVIEAARFARAKKVIAMGTGAVYAEGVFQPMRETDIFVGRPHPSEAGYAHAKRGMLAMLEAYQESYGLDWAYVVSCNLYGPRDKFTEEGHVVPNLIRKFSTPGPITVWGDGSARRDFLYIEDAADAIIKIAHHLSGPVNLGSGHVSSIRDVVQTLSAITGITDIVWDPTKPNGQAHRSYDLSHLHSTGFTKSFSLATGLRKTLDWYMTFNRERAQNAPNRNGSIADKIRSRA